MGFSGTVIGDDYTKAAFKLMNKMWQIVRSNGLKNNGLNIWVYGPDKNVFAGVELKSSPSSNIALEQKSISLIKYAYHKHIGPYSLIKQVAQTMRDE
jgi:hypothetical protein